ncbi:MAG: DNA-formamidopyrimidine glycosylase family protein [Candidatus Promineifilaceae bacterium]|nr:DNA-formamidopyrimidine glycosylase family protein [Candidatus Promineifilaceae bacterium]
MPELPDVAVFKRYFDATALHQTIKDVTVNDTVVLANVTTPELSARLEDRSFRETARHGKYLFASVDNHDVLVLHFGMTGRLAYFKSREDKPEHTQLLCTYANGYHLAYVSTRKLGEIRVIQDVEAFLRAKALGPDALTLDLTTFRDLLADRRGMLKSALMDQELMAGIGNVYSDEILYQARLHPRLAVNELDDDMERTLFEKMRSVLQTAIDHEAEPAQLPDHFLIPQRHEDGQCPECGGQVERIDVSGRSAYYCPSCQEKA